MYLPTHELAIKKALKRLGATNSDECSIKLEDKETDNLWFERVRDITATESIYAANNVLHTVERQKKIMNLTNWRLLLILRTDTTVRQS